MAYAVYKMYMLSHTMSAMFGEYNKTEEIFDIFIIDSVFLFIKQGLHDKRHLAHTN